MDKLELALRMHGVDDAQVYSPEVVAAYFERFQFNVEYQWESIAQRMAAYCLSSSLLVGDKLITFAKNGAKLSERAATDALWETMPRRAPVNEVYDTVDGLRAFFNTDAVDVDGLARQAVRQLESFKNPRHWFEGSDETLMI